MSRTPRWLSLLVCVVSPLSLAADKLPPRAVARLGDYRFYHGLGITCAVLSPDGRRAASGADSIVLWDAATGERLREMSVDRAPIRCLAFSPNGKRLVVGSGQFGGKYSVTIFDADTGKLLHQLTDFDQETLRVQFSIDGKQVYVSPREQAVSAWDAETGQQLRVWAPPKPPPIPTFKGVVRESVREGILSPDGKILIWRLAEDFDSDLDIREGTGDFLEANVLRICDAATNKLLDRKQVYGASFDSLVFSADGKRFAAVCGELKVWESASGKELRTFHAPSEGEEPVSFAPSPDLRRAVIRQANDCVRLWDLESGEVLHDLCHNYGRFIRTGRPQVFSADGNTLLLAPSKTLRLWDARTGQERLSSPGHRNDVETLLFAADGCTLFTCCGEYTCCWDVRTGKERDRLACVEDRTRRNGVLAHSPDGRSFLDQLHTDRVRLRDTATGRVRHEQLAVQCEDLVRGLFSPDAARVLLWDQTVWLYDAKTGQRVNQFAELDANGMPVFSEDSRLFAWAERGDSIRIYDTASGKVRRTIKSRIPLDLHRNDSPLLAFSRWGEYLAFASKLKTKQRVVRVFHVPSGKEVRRFPIPADDEANTFSCGSLALSPDGRLIAVGDFRHGTVYLIEVATGKLRVRLAGHRESVCSLAFAPDGQTLASGGGDNVVFLWDVTGAKTGVAQENGTAKNLSVWWSELAAEDAQRAGLAAALLIQTPQSVAYLKERLQPVEATDEKRLKRLLADLDNDAFEKREAASHELARLEERAEAALRQALKNEPSPEAKRRLEELLEKLDRHTLSPETLRAIRAVEALEHIGTPEARRLLEALAKGAPRRV